MGQQHQASKESVVALREQGVRLLKEGDYAGTARALEEAATLGDACAQNAFGVMHDGMFGLTRDWEAYIHWISLAAEQNYTPAFYNLGFVYEAGLGREASLPQALAWYTKGARLGHLASTKRLIDLYRGHKEVGVLHYLRAMVWRRRLARKGDAESQRILGIRYEQGWVFPRDVGEAIAWYQGAIAQGDKRAQLWQIPLKEEWETEKKEIAHCRMQVFLRRF